MNLKPGDMIVSLNGNECWLHICSNGTDTSHGAEAWFFYAMRSAASYPRTRVLSHSTLEYFLLCGWQVIKVDPAQESEEPQ